MSIERQDVGIGLIGCGGFGLFALEQFAQVPGVRLVGLSDTNRAAAGAAAVRFGLPSVTEVEDLLRMPGLDLVYIATPPFLHYPQAMQSLRADKHVLVEKPTALHPAQADEMLAVAQERGLLLATDLMQRYNPLFDSVRGLLERKPLGELLHAYFENYATDESLPPEHWFWDRSQSGGIFVEHGVHFFDLFAGWLGPGRVEAAQVCLRPGTDVEDQVQCTVRYGETVLVNFYHGFTQPRRLDRQELRLVFERGDVRLAEWIPVHATVHAVVGEADASTLRELFNGARLDMITSYAGQDRFCSGRHKALEVSQKMTIEYGDADQKMPRYRELLRALFEDQLAWLADRRHVRKVSGRAGRDALATAVEADRMAHGQS